MSEVLGVLAGSGMLLLVFVLVVAFLRQIGLLTEEKCRQLGRISLMVSLCGLFYWGLGALICQVLYESLDSAAKIRQIFGTPYLQRMYDALETPVWIGPLSTPFVFLGYITGKILFGQFLLGGLCWAFLLTLLGVWLFYRRLSVLQGKKMAEDAAFLLLCLPGSVYFFLPGWAPVFLALAAGAFFIAAGKKPAKRTLSYSPTGYAVLLALSGMLSAAVTAMVVMGSVA